MAIKTTYDMKPAFQRQLRPLCGWLASHGVQPNHVTLAAMVISAIQGAFIILWPAQSWPMLTLPVILAIRMVMNAVDGVLAREYGMQSLLGIVLNELGDVLSDILLYLPLALVPGISPPLIIILVILANITEFCGVIAVQTGSRRSYAGPMGKSDRALVMSGCGILIGLGMTPGIWIDLMLLLVITLSTVTIINRIYSALRPVRI